MKTPLQSRFRLRLLITLCPMLVFAAALLGQASLIPSTELMSAEELAHILQSQTARKPLVLQVGSGVLFEQAHIPGAEYMGGASTAAGIAQLRNRLGSVPKNQFIVLYCGCCPWDHCPNVKPAFELLRSMGFTHFKVLYIPNNFGTDWVNKGYPVAR